MTPRLTIPTSPYRGLRTIDAFGAGGYQAPRGDHRHQGLDFRAESGDIVAALCPCVVSHVGVAYPESDLGSIHLDGMGDYTTFRLKLLYTTPRVDTIVGATFNAGDPIAVAQSVAGYWQARHPERGPMQNHVHVEVEIDGHKVDPAFYITFPTAAA